MAPADDDDALTAEWESALGDGEGGEDSGDGDDLAARTFKKVGELLQRRITFGGLQC